MTWQDRFDRLLGAMAKGEPHKAQKLDLPKVEKPKPNKAK